LAASIFGFGFHSFAGFSRFCQSDVTRNVTRENSLSRSHVVVQQREWARWRFTVTV